MRLLQCAIGKKLQLSIPSATLSRHSIYVGMAVCMVTSFEPVDIDELHTSSEFVYATNPRANEDGYILSLVPTLSYLALLPSFTYPLENDTRSRVIQRIIYYTCLYRFDNASQLVPSYTSTARHEGAGNYAYSSLGSCMTADHHGSGDPGNLRSHLTVQARPSRSYAAIHPDHEGATESISRGLRTMHSYTREY